MIYQTLPRKGYENCTLSENEGFFIEGINEDDSVQQLREYADKHPEKWIYIHSCGYGISKNIPVSRHVIEVHIFDKEPANLMISFTLIQKGCNNEHEIDEMSEDEKTNLYMKQLAAFAMLGSSYRGGSIK